VTAQAAAVSLEILAATRLAIANLQFNEVIIRQGIAGFYLEEFTSVAKPEAISVIEKLYVTDVKAASMRMIDRLAKIEAQKYSVEEIDSLATVSKLPLLKKMLLAIIKGQPQPAQSKLSVADRPLFTKVISSDYFKTFQSEVWGDAGNRDEDVSILSQRTVKKYLAQSVRP
jgi:hypothetical protein